MTAVGPKDISLLRIARVEHMSYSFTSSIYYLVFRDRNFRNFFVSIPVSSRGCQSYFLAYRIVKNFLLDFSRVHPRQPAVTSFISAVRLSTLSLSNRQELCFSFFQFDLLRLCFFFVIQRSPAFYFLCCRTVKNFSFCSSRPARFTTISL